MHLVFSDVLPDDRKGKYVHFRHRKICKNGWEYCNIKGFISANIEFWISEIEKWHAKLSEIGINHTEWWWVVPGSRLIVWYPVFSNLLFSIALIDYCKRFEREDLYVLGCPRSVCNYIRELAPDIRLTHGWTSERNYSGFWKSVFTEFWGFGRSMKRVYELAFKNPKRHFNPKNLHHAKLVVCSFLLDGSSLEEKGDHYFGKIIGSIPGVLREDIIWLYLSHKKEDKDLAVHHLESKGYCAVLFLEDLVGRRELIQVMLEAFLVRFKTRCLKSILPEVRIGPFRSRLCAIEFFNDFISGIMPINELVAYYGMKKLLSDSSVKVILYPYEEKGIERAILMAADDSNARPRTVGYAHAAYNQTQLYLRNSSTNGIKPPRPDTLAVCGSSLKHWLVDWASWDAQRIRVVGSARYHTVMALKKNNRGSRVLLRVLFLVGHGYQIGILANFIEECRDLFQGCELLIRPYPHSYHKEQKKGINTISKLLDNVRVETGSLMDQLAWCDVAIFCSTSAGIEAMLCGRLSIYVDLNEFFDLSPVTGKVPKSEILECFNPIDLKEMLLRIKRMNSLEYGEFAQRQHNSAVGIFSATDYNKLRQIVEYGQ